MPSVTLPTTEDKNIVKKALPTCKVLTSAVARLYIVLPHTHSWTYSQRWGAATFCKDKKKNDAFFIRLVDLENHTGVLWEQELYNVFEYTKDKAFFHVFGTDDYLAGLEFVDENEAETFYKKVMNRDTLHLKDSAKANNHWKSPSQKSHIDKTTISNPVDFRHLEHIGYATGKGFTIENNNDEQNAMIDQLKALSITPEEINQNQDFIHQFLNQHNTGNHAAAKNTTNSAPPQPSSAVSPVPSLNKTGRRPLPPPPPPRKKTTTVPPASPIRPPAPTRPIPASTSLPPIPQRGSRQPHQESPVIQPNMEGTMSPPPPPPPPPPMMTQAPIRSSPLPPTNCPPAPPPPSPPSSSNSDLPPVSDGRSNLMASIRSRGGVGSLRKGTHTRHTPATAAVGVGGGAAALASTQGGNDDNNDGNGLASSLAAVLKQRQTAMQSDDEDDDDDWE
ncbi:WH1 domain-domain-containing protein [Absidia repens]|uniref:WH1 domain-domain-containing protein n=1 Tax=Absidia repens TaxID=90262 RepID=A0A1X2IED4_9FUNG|nr:WH1 domain-domain-containing protein [Absidia repens]